MNPNDFSVYVAVPCADATETFGHALGLPCIPCSDIATCSNLEHAPVVLVAGWKGESFAVCADVRSRTSSPIVLLVDEASPHALTRGLHAGADLVVSKNTDPGELEARIRALVRRSRMPGPQDAYRLLRVCVS